MCLNLECLFWKSGKPDDSEETSSTSLNGQASSLNLNEEYAKAFRTKSYNEFWSKVRRLTGNHDEGNGHSTCHSRLPSYRLFAENLLEPDQETVKQILQLTEQSRNNYGKLVSNYFDNSAEASELCVLLLQNIEEARLSYRSVEKVLDTTPTAGEYTDSQCNLVIREFRLFMELQNPFSASTLQLFQGIHQRYGDLHKQLERNQKLKSDAAIKGAYILNRDLDTMSRIVTRLNDEVEHNRLMVRLCLEREDDRHHLQEVVRLLRKDDNSFSLQLDELEEHVYLCFMTLNRFRRLVVKEMHPNFPNNCSSVNFF